MVAVPFSAQSAFLPLTHMRSLSQWKSSNSSIVVSRQRSSKVLKSFIEYLDKHELYKLHKVEPAFHGRTVLLELLKTKPAVAHNEEQQ